MAASACHTASRRRSVPSGAAPERSIMDNVSGFCSLLRMIADVAFSVVAVVAVHLAGHGRYPLAGSRRSPDRPYRIDGGQSTHTADRIRRAGSGGYPPHTYPGERRSAVDQAP